MASTDTKPTSGVRGGSPAGGENPAVAAAVKRSADAEASLKKIQQDYTKTSTLCATAKAAADRLSEQKKQTDAQYESARATHEECAVQLESMKHLQAFAEVDIAIAALELELHKAEAEAAGGGEEARAAAAAAKERLEKEKEWRDYDALKDAADKAFASLDRIARENERRAKMAELQATVTRLEDQIKKKEQEREAQDAKAKQLASEVLKLQRELEAAEREVRGEGGEGRARR